MTPWVKILLVANIAMYFVQMTMPALANAFVFVPAYVLVRPWTIVTYMFLHGGLMHLLFNMLGLYFFGSRVEMRLGERRFAILYFLSGISGALLSFAFARRYPIIGASAGVFGVMMAYAHFWPRDLIYIWGVLPIQARWLVILTTLLAIWSGFGGVRSGVAHFAHLGGYVGAYLYLRWLEHRKGAFKRAAVPRVADTALNNWKKVDVSRVHEVNRDELNRILDKINAQGLGSLTPQERGFLSSFVPPDDRVPPPT